jgi:hypothetical protein
MNNATIIIPFFQDSSSRVVNLIRTLCYLNKNLSYKILIINQNLNDSETYLRNLLKTYSLNNTNLINLNIEAPCYKTKLINEGLDISDTEINIIYDCDVLIPKDQIILGVDLIEKYNFGLVYPYSNPQYNLPITTEIQEDWDFEQLQYSTPLYQIPHLHQSHGYPVIGYSPGFCVIVNKKLGKIIYYNEDFRSPQFEDTEYLYKMDKLGVKMTRVYGPIFHVDHERTEVKYKDIVENNKNIFEYIKSLNINDLKSYYNI